MVEGASNLPTDGWLVWEIPDKPVSVRVRRDVIGRLGAVVRQGFKALPRRGLETGGLLVGTRAEAGGHVVVTVYDFEPVESEHASGPSYLLSDTDRRRLEACISARQAATHKIAVVGFYRSHTRPDFEMTAEDASLFSTYFENASDVFLLIKSNEGAPPTGGFIIREVGEVRSRTPYLQFPFDQDAMFAAIDETSVPVQAPESQSPRQETAQAAERQQSMWPRSWRTRTTAAGAMVLAVALPFAIQRRISGPAPAAPGAPLALKVSSAGNSLRLSWNHASRSATHAVLWIKDGQNEQRFELDPRQLGQGSVAYWPRNHDVTFRLEVHSAGATVTESVRSIGEPAKPSPTQNAVVGPVPPEAPVPLTDERTDADRSSSPDDSRRLPRRNHTGMASRRTTRAFVLPPAKSNLAMAAPVSLPEPPTVHAVPVPAVERNGELSKLMDAGSKRRFDEGDNSLVRVRAEPAAASRFGHLARSLGLVKKSKRADYIPPVALRHSVPPNSPPPKVAREVGVDVKVYVNAAGKVEYSELDSKVPKANMNAAVWAVFAARHWEFTPARTADGAVEGEMILHYQFEPELHPAVGQALVKR